jgi:hypothetical protein
MRGFVSMIVLAVALSVGAGNCLGRDFYRASRTHDLSSHGASGWSDRSAQTPVIEAASQDTTVADRSTEIPRAASMLLPASRVSAARSPLARPHDPPYLHTFTLLI